MSSKELKKGLLLGLGNPLLDISANTDDSFLKKYDMKPNDAILAEDQHLPMYREMVEKYIVDYTAGGACQNAMRAAQWILEKPEVTAFMGCIGKDNFGEILENKAKDAGVLVSYQYHDKLPTGTCAVVITDKGANRSLCANLSAANCFSKDHLDVPANKALIECAEFFYITGFFLTVSPKSIITVAEHALTNSKPFIMNLSAPFICQFFKDPLLEALPYVDILFGNDQEARAFASANDFEETKELEVIALQISKLPKKNKKPRIVIITRGRDPVVVVTDKDVIIYAVNVIDEEDIVDTNGAGDAFVGAFLAQYIQGKDLHTCVKCAIYAGTDVTKRSGCTFAEKSIFYDDYEFEVAAI